MLFALGKAAALGGSKTLYDANREVYGLLRYGVSETAEQYWLRWKEAGSHPAAADNPLLRELSQLCARERLLEIVHDFMVFDDLTLVQMIVERGNAAVESLPEGIRNNREAVAETIENNVRRLIIDESAVNPKYYEKMSTDRRLGRHVLYTSDVSGYANLSIWPPSGRWTTYQC